MDLPVQRTIPILVLALCLLGSPTSGAQEASNIRKDVTRLSNTSEKVQQEAERKLLKLGLKAIPELKRSLESIQDAKGRARCLALIKKIRSTP